MLVRNAEVVDLLQLIGDLMELRGDEAFKVRAYREAARQLDLAAEDVDMLAREGRLTGIKGVGPSIARTIKEYLETGRSTVLEQLRADVPESLIEMLGLRHFGPARIARVYRTLGVQTLDELEAAARDGRLEAVPGFGRKTVETLLSSIQRLREHRRRIPRYIAEAVGAAVAQALRQAAALRQVEVAGSVRRRAETAGNVDLVAAADEPAVALDAFLRLPILRDGRREGPRRALAQTREGYPVRLWVVPPALWGQGLQQVTGSVAHNEQVRQRARALGLGVHGAEPADASQAEDDGTFAGFLLEPSGALLEAPDERALYERLGLPWVPPELREGRGEIAAALAGRLPRLIDLADLRGDLHVHTTWSDGRHSIEQMARKARELGREYLAIADHSQSLGVARGLTLERLAAQRREIAAVDAALDGIRLLSSVELDIRWDGSLDYPDEVLAQFDFVTASIHSGFQQPSEQLTRRVLAAVRHPHVDAIGHLTGRVLGRRDPLELDVEAILQAAAETGTALEINAWPNRLDIHEQYARRAKELGAKIVINTDAHADDQLAYLRYGVEIARRAWLEPGDVLNTLPLEALLASLSRRRDRA
jgi:DNA polymerase (family 10)